MYVGRGGGDSDGGWMTGYYTVGDVVLSVQQRMIPDRDLQTDSEAAIVVETTEL